MFASRHTEDKIKWLMFAGEHVPAHQQFKTSKLKHNEIVSFSSPVCKILNTADVQGWYSSGKQLPYTIDENEN